MKPRWRLLIVACMSFATMVFIFNNCSQISFLHGSSVASAASGGGVAGNPATPSHPAASVLSAICVVLEAGHPGLSDAECVSGVEKENIAGSFGVPNGWYNPISGLVELETLTTLPLNANAYESCAATIAALSPSSAAVQAAYVASQSDPFSGVGAIIPSASGSCPGIYATVQFVSACPQNSSNIFWVYQNGVYSWGQDLTFYGSSNYTDTSGNPLSPPYDIKVTINQAFGAWQVQGLNPFTNTTSNFPLTGCNYLTFSMQSTVANQSWGVRFNYGSGNSLLSSFIYTNSGLYGQANPQVGTWYTYKVPLSAFFPGGSVPAFINLMQIGDELGLSSNVYYVDNVGFSFQ